MANSLSDEASRLMEEFEWALDVNTNAENTYGLNGFGETVPFTTKKFLVQYWTYEQVEHLLLSFTGRNNLARDIDMILSEYILVFSILTKLRKSDWIRKFLQSRIKDRNLPIRTSMPNQWTDQEIHRELWESFITEQWAFCPYTFDRTLDRLSDAELSESYIFPIHGKACLKGEVDGGELAVLYRYTLHPAFQNNLSEHVVFKEYHGQNPMATIAYENEVSIYTTLKRDLTGTTALKGSTAFKNIIEYYGSFQTRQKRTIMLEYATGGDLSTFFETIDPPSNVKHLTTFWINFFELLLGLGAVHILDPAESDKDTYLLKGVHQDIRPQKILLVPKSERTYNFTFKLVDFGTGYVKKQSLDRLRQRHGDSPSNAIYSSPESITGRWYPESEIWALGALASETLIWTVQGMSGVKNYHRLRRDVGQMIPGLEESHYGCFHDGIKRLPLIDDLHRDILKKVKPEDKISVMVSQFILEHMLIEYPDILQGDTSEIPRFRRGSKETHRLWQMKLSEISPNEGIPALDIRPSTSEKAESDSSEVFSVLSEVLSLSSSTSSGSNLIVADLIARFLLEDDEIGTILSGAPITVLADRDRAQNNLRTLLRRYGIELLHIANPGLQKTVATSVRHRSKNIVQMIRQHLERTHGSKKFKTIKEAFPELSKAEKQELIRLYLGNQISKPIPDQHPENETLIPLEPDTRTEIEKDDSEIITVDEPRDYPDDDSEDESEDETEYEDSDRLETNFQDQLMEAKQFLRTEQPLNNLIQGLKKLFPSREPLVTLLEGSEEQSTSEPLVNIFEGSEKQSTSEFLTTIPEMPEEKSMFELEPYHTTTSKIERRRGAFPNFPSLVDRILNAVISHNYEPLVPEGMQRVRWVCNHCGTKLFDDFEIADLSVLGHLEDQLRANNTDQNGRMNKLKHVVAQIMGKAFTFVSSMVPQRQATSLQDSLDLQRRVDSAARQQRGQTVRDELYLLLCVDTGDFNTRLLQSGMQHVKDDHDLFEHLRQTYYESQNPSRWFTLRSVNSLHLRRFKLDFSDYPETHKHEDQCQRLDCICLPPKEYVGTEPGKEYRCGPAPQRQGTEPAIGCNRLTHYFHCAGAPKIGQTTILEQLPKRTCGKLSASEHQEVLGWGIHFEEGWHWRTIKVLVVFFSLSSSAFGIVWTFIRGDMSGAFTVSGWWMALGAGLLSFLALRSKTQ